MCVLTRGRSITLPVPTVCQAHDRVDQEFYILFPTLQIRKQAHCWSWDLNPQFAGAKQRLIFFPLLLLAPWFGEPPADQTVVLMLQCVFRVALSVLPLSPRAEGGSETSSSIPRSILHSATSSWAGLSAPVILTAVGRDMPLSRRVVTGLTRDHVPTGEERDRGCWVN